MLVQLKDTRKTTANIFKPKLLTPTFEQLLQRTIKYHQLLSSTIIINFYHQLLLSTTIINYHHQLLRYSIPEALRAMREDALRASREHLVELCGDALWTKASEETSWLRIQLDEATKAKMKGVQEAQRKEKKEKHSSAQSGMKDYDSDNYDDMEDFEEEGEGSGVSLGAR